MLLKNVICILSTNSAEMKYFGTKIVSSTKIIIHAVVKIQSTGNTAIGQDYSLKCTVMLTSGEQIATLKWKNSTGNVLNMSTTSTSLWLSFSPVSVSDGGIYTCEATYNNRNTKQNSRTFVVTGNT